MTDSLVVVLRPGDDVNRALKLLKRQCEKARLFAELRRRRHFQSPTERRRAKHWLAVAKIRRRAQQRAEREAVAEQVERERRFGRARAGLGVGGRRRGWRHLEERAGRNGHPPRVPTPAELLAGLQAERR